MKYEFPVIEHIDQVRDAINGIDEFKIIVKDGYSVANYLVRTINTFPYVGSDIDLAIRRECRGIIFDNATGKILRRPYHKFFNVNEVAETQIDCIDLDQNHVILEKLDGSMISPFLVNSKMIWGTKMGQTDIAMPVQCFAENQLNYVEFAKEMVENMMSPIFEWCSLKQRIVIAYEQDQLVLTAVRNMTTGQYVSYKDLVDLGNKYNIPVIGQINQTVSDLGQLVAHTRDLKNAEGFVVRFDDGHMTKIKAEEYLRFHKTKELFNFEKDIIKLILSDQLDDCKGFMSSEDRTKVESFESAVVDGLKNTSKKIADMVNQAKLIYGNNKKDFAVEFVAQQNEPYIKPLLFAVWDHGCDQSFDLVKRLVLSSTSTGSKVAGVRNLWGGHEWTKYHQYQQVDD